MAGPTHKFIKVADLIPTQDNPRTVRTDSESFRTLADSVKAEGVRIPVIARPHPNPKKKGKYDLIAGARRHAAAKLAKLKSIPVLVYEDMTDEAAFDMTFLENFAREDLTVLEEAQAVATLLEKNKGDVKAVADKFDKSEKWIRLRANVHGNLSDKWLAVIANIGNFEAERGDRESASDIAHFGIGHYALIARFSKAVQDDILEDAIGEEMTVDDLGKACDELLMDLSAATWDGARSFEVSDNEIKRPKCDGCPKRTGHQPMLWDDDPKKGKVDRCLDPACWKDKIALAMGEKIATAKAKHEGLKLLTTECGYIENSEIAKAHGDLLELSDVQTANKSDKDAFPCFVVRGKQVGKVVWRKKPSGGSSGRSAVSGPKPLKARRKILASKRWCLILKAMQDAVEKATLESIQHEDKLLAVMAIVTHVGIDTDNDNYWDEFAESMAKGRDHVLAIMWDKVKGHLCGSISYNGGNTQLHDSYIDNAMHIIKLLGLPEADYLADAAKAIPEPKTWASLNENGTPKATKKMTVKKKVKKAKKTKK